MSPKKSIATVTIIWHFREVVSFSDGVDNMLFSSLYMMVQDKNTHEIKRIVTLFQLVRFHCPRYTNCP